MQITLSNCVKIENPDTDIQEYCKKHLWVANPEYYKRERLGIWTGATLQALQKRGLCNKRGGVMDIKIVAYWCKNPNSGYCDAMFVVFGSENNILMRDENFYYNFGKFLDHLIKLFVNDRFKWDKVQVWEKSQKMIWYGKDLKKGGKKH